MSTAALEVASPQLPEAVARRGMDEFQWRTLTNSLFPGAATASVLMVIDYCRARKLDPLKKPCHIVPIRVKQDNQWVTRDVVMPGIYEYRTTAHRTGLYLGHTKAEYGPEDECAGVTAPTWCDITMLRWHRESNRVIEFPVRVLFDEVVATKQDGKANERWSKAPTQMLTKCTEAAGLREAFPEEFGGEPTAEEMDGQRAIEVDGTVIKMPERRSEQNGNGTTTTASAATVTTVNPPTTTATVEDEMPAAADRIVDAQKHGPSATGKHWWTVKTARGLKAYTWSTRVGPMLEGFKASGALVTLDVKPDKNGGISIDNVEAFDALGGAGREPGAEG